MKKLINDVDNVLAESLDGFAAAHADILALGAAAPVRAPTRSVKPGKVALISGGGSGHEPLHAGFVGHGMLDAACPGQVFTSPTPDQMLAAAQAVDGGAGVLFIVKNYSGDMMNFQMAAEMLDRENATRDRQRRRRGRELHLHHRPPRRGGHVDRREDRRCRGRARRQPAALKALGDCGQQAPPPRWAWRSPRAPCRRPASRPSRSATTRWRWASASTASRGGAREARQRRRDRRRDDGRDPEGPGVEARPAR